MHTAKFIFCSFLLLLVHLTSAWLSNQPQDVGTDVPSGKLMSLSFAPFREGYSPLEEKFPTREQVEEDLSLLADKTHNIRTYSSLGGGIEATPELARKYGINVIQGAWLGYGYEDNKKEVDALIQSANANQDVVKRLIVGNEVLLRGDMDVNRLITYIREVKRAVKQPVSYADVWSMYMKHPQLIKEVDFITIHILPYWEDEPISVENAPEHLEKIVRQVEEEARGIAPGKPILIGESGWPSAGRQRGMALPSVVNEAKFIRDMIDVVNRHGFDYNIVEAFNQPWKSNLEGVVGANWGLFSADRKPVFPLTGLVSENPKWFTHAMAASALWMLILMVYFKKLQSFSVTRFIVFLALAQIFSVCLVSLADFLWYTSYSAPQRIYTIFITTANAMIGVMLLCRYIALLGGDGADEKWGRWLRNAYLFFILLALYKTYGLSINGRYLSFPVEQFVLPVVGIIGLIICQWLSQGRLNTQLINVDQLTNSNSNRRYQRTIAYLLSFSIAGLVFGETEAFMVGRDFIEAHPEFPENLFFALDYTLHNQQLLSWLVCLFILSLPCWNTAERKTKI